MKLCWTVLALGCNNSAPNRRVASTRPESGFALRTLMTSCAVPLPAKTFRILCSWSGSSRVLGAALGSKPADARARQHQPPKPAAGETAATINHRSRRHEALSQNGYGPPAHTHTHAREPY